MHELHHRGPLCLTTCSARDAEGFCILSLRDDVPLDSCCTMILCGCAWIFQPHMYAAVLVAKEGCAHSEQNAAVLPDAADTHLRFPLLLNRFNPTPCVSSLE